MALCEVPCAVIPVRPPLTDEEVTDRPKGSPGQKWQAVLVHGGIIFHSVYISHLFCPSIDRHTLRSPVNDAAVISSTRSFCLIDLSLFFFSSGKSFQGTNYYWLFKNLHLFYSTLIFALMCLLSWRLTFWVYFSRFFSWMHSIYFK